MPGAPREPERLDLRSHDVAADKRAELLRVPFRVVVKAEDV